MPPKDLFGFVVFGFVFTPKSFLAYFQYVHIELELQLGHTVIYQS
jgi:hypothetical protein